MALIAISLQVFWQKFYKNCSKGLICEKYWKIFSSEAIRGIKLKLCRNVRNISLAFFIAVVLVLSLLWQLKFSIDLKWKKWNLEFIAISLQIFWQHVYRNVPWVVVYETCHFCPNVSLQIFWQHVYRNVPSVVVYETCHFCPTVWIWLVAMETERLNLRKSS